MKFPRSLIRRTLVFGEKLLVKSPKLLKNALKTALFGAVFHFGWNSYTKSVDYLYIVACVLVIFLCGIFVAEAVKFLEKK